MRGRIAHIGLIAAASAMIAGAVLAGDAAPAETRTGQRFYLGFDMLAPADLSCDAQGPGLRVKQTRDLAGKPVLRLTGNAQDAQISCWRPDGSRYATEVNRAPLYTTVGPLWATVSFSFDRDAMTVVLARGDDINDIVKVVPRAFRRVVAGTGTMDSSPRSLGGRNDGASQAPALTGD